MVATCPTRNMAVLHTTMSLDLSVQEAVLHITVWVSIFVIAEIDLNTSVM